MEGCELCIRLNSRISFGYLVCVGLWYFYRRSFRRHTNQPGNHIYVARGCNSEQQRLGDTVSQV
ncbi:hypothetical protein K474DRAFT_1063056 [Panus rudis PR-1116 ss-1]|nr:hypothetical protein K474DRAFT_1063056 [Panus rudis PR-1116 ss-1]